MRFSSIFAHKFNARRRSRKIRVANVIKCYFNNVAAVTNRLRDINHYKCVPLLCFTCAAKAFIIEIAFRQFH